MTAQTDGWDDTSHFRDGGLTKYRALARHYLGADEHRVVEDESDGSWSIVFDEEEMVLGFDSRHAAESELKFIRDYAREHQAKGRL